VESDINFAFLDEARKRGKSAFKVGKKRKENRVAGGKRIPQKKGENGGGGMKRG